MAARVRHAVTHARSNSGVGKTGLMVALAEWFEANEIPFTVLDLDTENKARGSLKHFFNGSVAKVNIHTPAGLDAFVDHLESGAAIILADMGLSDHFKSGQRLSLQNRPTIGSREQPQCSTLPALVQASLIKG